MSIAIAARRAAGIVSLGEQDRASTLSTAVCRVLASAYDRFARDPMIYALIVRSQHDGAFAAGLDTREIAELARHHPQAAASAIGDMLRVCWQQECFTKPIVSLLDGQVEGGGPGVSLHGTHRVAGERYGFACAATDMGLVPAGGLCHVLAHLANSVGIYLALTGHCIGRADALRHGLVTHCIDDRHFDTIEEQLADADPVDPILDGLHRDPPGADLPDREAAIARCFSADSVDGILARLESERGADAAWARETAADLRQKSPLAIKVSLDLIRRARGLDLSSLLLIEYGVLAHLVARPDVQRAILDERGGDIPAWEPAALAGVTESLRAAVFAAPAGPNLTLRARADMQSQT